MVTSLQIQLDTIDQEIEKAKGKSKEIAETFGDLTLKQTQIQTNCEALELQNQEFRTSNDELFSQAQKIGGNLGALGESADQVSEAVSDAAASLTNNLVSRWNSWGMLGAALGGGGAAAIGAGIVAVGGITAAGTVLIPFAAALFKGYGVLPSYIADARNKCQVLANEIGNTLSEVQGKMENVRTGIANFVTGTAGLWKRITNLVAG